jgi:RNA polymerase sigma-70 factor (ECF subfamily)
VPRSGTETIEKARIAGQPQRMPVDRAGVLVVQVGERVTVPRPHARPQRLTGFCMPHALFLSAAPGRFPCPAPHRQGGHERPAAAKATGGTRPPGSGRAESGGRPPRRRRRPERGGGSLTPWLFGIATHKAHNANRGLRRRLAFLARSPEPRPVEDFSDETAGRVDDARRLALVHGALRRLGRADREVIALCVGAGLDYQQAAEALGIPVGTVRSRLSRARARLARASSGPVPRNDVERRGRHGEKESEAAFAALFLQEETR